jgi:hypothetical protein
MQRVIWLSEIGELFYIADGSSRYLLNNGIFFRSRQNGCKPRVIYPRCVLFKRWIYYIIIRGCSLYRKFCWELVNPLTPELNPSAQRFLTRFFTGDFVSLNVHLINLKEPCVLYIGRAHRYPSNTLFYIFFQQIYVLNFLKMMHSPFYLFKMPFIS